jgi:hypothetical protein
MQSLKLHSRALPAATSYTVPTESTARFLDPPAALCKALIVLLQDPLQHSPVTGVQDEARAELDSAIRCCDGLLMNHHRYAALAASRDDVLDDSPILRVLVVVRNAQRSGRELDMSLGPINTPSMSPTSRIASRLR